VILGGCSRGVSSSGGAALTADQAAAVCANHQAHICDPSETHKITICHVPPGNPANAHTLCVGSPAKEAHLAHGDALGACACPHEGDPPPTEPDPPEGDDGSAAPTIQ
jgi:hypothetical protein